MKTIDIKKDICTVIDYSTDGSVYRERPFGVVYPESGEHIGQVIEYANSNGLGVIPRAGGTSLAGQVVGSGIVVDVSRNLNKILEINVEERYAIVEPGVVRDVLNDRLKEHGLMFAPETSTSNRCTISGMVGNNSCGANSLVYGSTRDHLLEVKGFLSDGSFVCFKALSETELKDKLQLVDREGDIYRKVWGILSNKDNRDKIESEFPDKRLRRRNNGYALDTLLDCKPFKADGERFNMCRIIAGSEGTLVFASEIKVALVPLPPVSGALICVHFNSLDEALKANLRVLEHKPYAVELMDGEILKLAEQNGLQKDNSFFISGKPGAILIVEVRADNGADVDKHCEAIIGDLKSNGIGYDFPILKGADINKVWALRKAGLGVLSNLKGEAKPVAVIEDTAVLPEFLPDYIADIKQMLAELGLSCIYYAHIGTGELHLRPILNLKDTYDVNRFKELAWSTARIVKKYRGSLSGEHGDGRLRGEFIPYMLGQECYEMICELKDVFDPNNILNRGKIVRTPNITDNMRFEGGVYDRCIDTLLRFDEGILRSVERCNGSADCRKPKEIGGLMCPTYMATGDEMMTTRARANVIREVLTFSDNNNVFDDESLLQVVSTCISCKACKRECPSNIDMAKFKAEVLFQYQKLNGISFKNRMIGEMPTMYSLFSNVSFFFNIVVSNNPFSRLIKGVLGFAQQRSIPKIKMMSCANIDKGRKKVCLLVDEFTHYNDGDIGDMAVKLLDNIGYDVKILTINSGRTYISKGMLGKAKKVACKNVNSLTEFGDCDFVGIEPSAILSFRDEYVDMVDEADISKVKDIGKRVYLFEEFFMKEVAREDDNVKALFNGKGREIYVHGHCQQKAVASVKPLVEMLKAVGYSVNMIESCCCGMAGSFGYEKKNYDLSMKIGEMFLFPEVRKASSDSLIVAPGVSCRHQIFDGTGRKAIHPIEAVLMAVKHN